MGLRVGIETGIEARLTELMGLLTLPPHLPRLCQPCYSGGADLGELLQLALCYHGDEEP